MSSDVIEHSVDFFRKFFAVFSYFFSYHFDSAERTDTSLQRLICLKTYDNIFSRNYVSRLESIDSHNSAGVNFQSAAGFSFLYKKFLNSRGTFFCSLSRSCQEAGVAVIWLVVKVNKLFYADGVHPVTFDKSFPLFSHSVCILLIFCILYTDKVIKKWF